MATQEIHAVEGTIQFSFAPVGISNGKILSPKEMIKDVEAKSISKEMKSALISKIGSQIHESMKKGHERVLIPLQELGDNIAGLSHIHHLLTEAGYKTTSHSVRKVRKDGLNVIAETPSESQYNDNFSIEVAWDEHWYVDVIDKKV